MRVKLWGVRGSLPAPLTPDRLRYRLEDVLTQFERLRDSNIQLTARAFIETLPPHLSGGYGGNTSCGEITAGNSRLLIDGGSGLRGFSEHMMQSHPTQDDFHMYFTHFHWDHLIGLPFFVPMYIRGKTVNFYGVQADLEDNIRRIFRKPNFPVPYELIEKQIRIHNVEPRQPFQVGELKCTPYELDHPDPCWGVRVEHKDKAIAWSVDTECTRMTREEMGEDVKLYHKADLMVFDAQYTFDEALEKINWGHSSGPTGIDLALREEVKRAVFVHHDPAASDENIRKAEDETARYFDELMRARKRAGMPIPQLEWHFAREGEVIQL